MSLEGGSQKHEGSAGKESQVKAKTVFRVLPWLSLAYLLSLIVTATGHTWVAWTAAMIAGVSVLSAATILFSVRWSPK